LAGCCWINVFVST